MENIVLPPELGNFLGLILNAIIMTAIATLTPILRVYILNQVEKAKVSLGAERLFLLEQAARMAVRYAEQAGLKGLIEDTAEKKLSLASNAVIEISKNLGIEGLTPMEWRAAIEAALREGAHLRPEPIDTKE